MVKWNSVMRILSTSLIVLLLFAASAWAPSVITQFDAITGGDYVILNWTSGSEAGLSNFQVERSLDGLDFQAIATISPLGSNTDYSYEDHDLYKTTTRTYFYRIKAQMTNGSSNLSPVKSITLSFSGIQQTWGSIKSLFR